MIDKEKQKLNMKVQWTKFAIVLVLYLAFLIWLKSWLGLIVVPFIFDVYITKKIRWQWWKDSEGPVRFIMSWVDALVFALVAVYFINLFFFQNYVIPSSLGLNQAPLRIECYDISNTVGGAFQVASMVVFEDAIAKKSEYRRFSIRGKDGQGAVDDLSALYETLTRRFKHGNIAGDSGESIDAKQRAAKAEQQQEQSASDVNGTSSTTPAAITDASSSDDSSAVIQQNTNRHHFAYKPNLVVVDGGKPQVMAAAKALEDCGVDDVVVCGLSKRLEEVWVPDDDYPIILKRQSEGMYLLQRVRDESHRFAITYHRQQRRKGALRSALDEIPGIGESYQKRLLNHFGSVKAMRMASVEDFEQVKGVGHAKAEALYAALHDE